jgi:hypothetical protein
MKTWLSIPVIVFVFLGCVFFGEERVKTFTARDVTEENVFSYGSVFVRINPDLHYLKISGDITVEIMGKLNTPTQKQFHIFTRPELNRIVLIETHTRKHPHTFEQQQNLTKNMATIQKGKKPIDGRIWDVYVRAHPRFPEQILSAVRQKGIQIPQYRCGLEIGVGRVINRFNRIYVSYLEGVDACNGLPQNGSVLSDIQIQMIREFANQFDANITISDQSGGS